MKKWKRRFEDPVKTPDGKELNTLHDAAVYIQRLPTSEQESKEWQVAISVLIEAAEGRGPLLHARAGVLQALHRNDPPKPFTRAVRERPWMRPKRVERK